MSEEVKNEEKKGLADYSCVARSEWELMPTYEAEINELRTSGLTLSLLYQIIQKHTYNAAYNKRLYNRYMAISTGVPIFGRQPTFDEERPINNKVNNDFFGEIVDFKVGYFAGEPISYSYSNTDESEDVTGGAKAVEAANKALTDFVVRNNMFGVDMETTKYATIYGYAGRLFYIDREGTERVMPVHGFETIILSNTDISEPEYAIRYFSNKSVNGEEIYTVEFYDDRYVTTFRGNTLYDLTEVEKKEHCFDYCPLQGVANNKECLGDAEKVLALIDDYDKVVSDNSNEIESFVHAYLIFEGLKIDDKTIRKGQKSGSFVFPAMGTQQGKAYFLTKDINDTYTENHLQRVEDNIYRFSRTPNLGDETFGSASGVSLKFKLHGLETKCATFEANVMNSAQHMWRVLASSWRKKGISFDPLQAVMEFHRNFPLDAESEARTIQAYIQAGLPKRYAFSKLSGVDDIEWLMDMLKEEQEETIEMYPALEKANETAQNDDDSGDEDENVEENADEDEE